MNKITRVVSAAAMTAAAVATAAGTALAAPAPTPAPAQDFHTLSTEIMPGVKYTSNTTDSSVVIQTGIGTLTTQGGQFQVKDTTGGVVAGTPQFVTKPKAQAAVEAPKVAEPAVKSVGKLSNVGDYQSDFNSSLSVAATQFGLATTVGTLAGAAVGIPIGCVVGGLTGGLIIGALTPFGWAGCVVGVGFGGTIGPLVGAMALGIPVGIASAAQMYNTMHANGHI